MKVLLLIHGILNSEVSIEKSFEEMTSDGTISRIHSFYYMDFFGKHGGDATKSKIKEINFEFEPDLVFLFHVSKFPIDVTFIKQLKGIKSNPILVYDEGDIYGGWSKPVTRSMKIAMRHADFVSLRGMGNWLRQVQKYNSNIIYTPHCASLSHLLKDNQIVRERRRKFVFIGNSEKSKLGNIRRLSGAKEREALISEISQMFPNEFEVYGRGWKGLKTNKGPIEYNDQIRINTNNWFYISYEHYPDVSHYYSDRLPNALFAGQIYLAHYHAGYDDIFKDCNFIFFFKTKEEAKERVRYLLSLGEDELVKLSTEAHNFARKNMLPSVVWRKTIQSIKSKISNIEKD